MRTRHIVALVIGCLLALPGIGSLIGGGALAAAYSWGRDASGYYTSTARTLQTETPAVTIEDVDIEIGPMPRWMSDQFAVDLRVRATPTDPARPLFLGVASAADVGRYLAGTAHDEITSLVPGVTTHYSRTSGADRVAPPTGQDFWTARDSGSGTRELSWHLTSGRWAVVLMNADGSAGVSATVTAGARVAGMLAIAFTLIGIGLVLTAIAAGLIAYAVARRQPVTAPHAPAGVAGPGGEVLRASGTPVVMTAQLDPQLSRALWLVKWFLAIPHFIVLCFLWAAFAVTTLIAWFAILFTTRYPRSLFDFNVGVLRWTWRVTYYCANGGLGSDRYPAFSLDPVPEDLTTLDIAYPGELSRGLIFVKWILAFPHLLITGALIGGGSWRWSEEAGRGWATDTRTTGLLGALAVAIAVVLLFTGAYPKGLFDLVVGLNRWVYRVAAYVLLMTDEYPPFRLDPGGMEQLVGGPSAPAAPATEVPPDRTGEAAEAQPPAAMPPPHGAAISELPPPEEGPRA